MSGRRKRTLESESPLVAPKRKYRKVNKDDKFLEQQSESYRIFNSLKDHKTEDGRTFVDWFYRAPSRRTDPKYYELFENPIDFNRINQKLKMEEYETTAAFLEDIKILIENNRKYYEEETDERRILSELEVYLSKTLEKKTNGQLNDEDTRSVSPSSRMSDGCETVDQEMVEDILTSILDLNDETGRILSPPFRVLQSKEQFPLYYEKVKHPIDLKTIAEKARAGSYTSYEQLNEDIRLLCANAKIFNESGSVISRDSTAILRFFTKKLKEAKSGQAKQFDTKRVEYNREMIDALIAQSTSSEDNEEFSEDSEEDEDTEGAEDPMWKLYWTIRNVPDDKDPENNAADPFLELPQKSYYPDYFEEIKNPMSFFMVNKKLKREEYKGIQELLDDVLLIFDNACSYNTEASEIYIKAKMLKRIALNTAKNVAPELNLTAYIKTEGLQETKSPPNKKSRTATIKKEAIRDGVDSDTGSDQSEKPKKNRKSTSQTPQRTKPGRKSIEDNQGNYRNALLHYWKYLESYKEGIHWPIGAFMELPSKNEYPDYYETIKIPIDMKLIRQRIERDYYSSSLHLMQDFSQMFRNCREYNETGSGLYNDSVVLERLVHLEHDRTPNAPLMNPSYGRKQPDPREMAPPTPSTNGHSHTPASKVNRTPKPPAPPRDPQEVEWMNELYEYLTEYADGTGRKLSAIFMKLPSRQEYPDYYDVIKKPMDFDLVRRKIDGFRRYSHSATVKYQVIGEMITDCRLMFDNACKYNESDSQVYKDAVFLQAIMMCKMRQMNDDNPEADVPSAQVEIRTIFTNIFAAIINKKDAEGRSLANQLMNELPELLKANEVAPEKWPYSFDQIKKNIDKGRYRRLDRFQQDFFALFETAREYARSSSQLYQDVVELQELFITERDERCKNVLTSQAILFIRNRFVEMIEKERHMKNKSELEEDKRSEAGPSARKFEDEADQELETYTEGDVNYRIHDYVYVKPAHEKSPTLHVMRIEGLRKNAKNEVLVTGKWFLRHHETYHRASRKFYENELFYTTTENTVLSNRLAGKCVVMLLSDYLRNTVKGYAAEDTFVCEFQYKGKQLHFHKLKTWPYEEEDEERYDYEPREGEFQPVKFVSSLLQPTAEDGSQMSSMTSNESEEDEDRCRHLYTLDVDRVEVPLKGALEDADGRVYFAQMITNGRAFKIGEFVLVFNPQRAHCDVMRIDKLWREADGNERFSGVWFARPAQVTGTEPRLYYKNELFAVYQADQTRSVGDIQAKCAVLAIKDFLRLRPTEIPEYDVYVCEQRVSGHGTFAASECSLFSNQVNGEAHDGEHESQPMCVDTAKKIRVLRNYHLPAEIQEDEIFYFKSPPAMEKDMSPLVAKSDLPPLDLDAEDDLDTDTDATDSTVSTPVPGVTTGSWLANQPKLNAKSKSGYILFSAEIRKRIMHENPEAGFGEVSKIVGIEWKKLTDDQKKQYESRADYIATERAKVEQATSASTQPLQANQCRVWLCKWLGCEFMCDQADGLFEHLVHHAAQIIPDSEQQYICMWGQCVRNRKEGKPFPSLPRLHRHLKEKHMGSACKVIFNNQRGRQFYRYTPPQGDQQQGSLSHFPYGMHPSQVAQAHPSVSSHLPPQMIPQLMNGDSQRMNGHHDAHHPHPTAAHPHPQAPQHYQATPGPSHAGPGYAAHHHPQQAHPHPQQHPHPGQQVHPAAAADPGRTVVQAQRGEPVFVAAPNSVPMRRALHTDAYIKYLETLSGRQRTISKYGKNLNANARNTSVTPNPRSAPYQWMKEARRGGPTPATDEELTTALWRLRDQLVESTVGICSEYQGPL